MSKNRAKKEQWRDEMVDAAEKLFFLQGYDSVSMGDIAREAGFYEATLRLFFRDKESLYFTVVMRGIRTLNAMYADHTESEATGLKKISAIGRAIYEFSRRYPDYYRSIYTNDPYDIRKDDVLGAVMNCVEGEAIRNELGQVEIALYLIMLSIGAIRADPCWKAALESTGVDFNRFAGDLPGFIDHVKANAATDRAYGQYVRRRHGGCKNSS